MFDTSLINTIILLIIIGLSISIFIKIKNAVPTDLSKLKTVYNNICSDGIDVNIPAGSLYNQKFLTSTLKLPESDATLKIKIKCN